MEPYKPNKPWISVNLPSREELIAMAMGLIPGGRALKNMYDNPEGPISETLDLAAEDLVPFYANLIKPAVKGKDINLRNNLIEAALIGLPLNGPRGVRRTDPKRVPIDEARTAEFNQKLNELTGLNGDDRMLANILLAEENPIVQLENVRNNGIKSLLERHGLGEYYDDLILRNNNTNPVHYFDPESRDFHRNIPDSPNNYERIMDGYEWSYLDDNRDNRNLKKLEEWYEAKANGLNVDKSFDEFLTDYYDRNKMDAYTREGLYSPTAAYEYTPSRQEYTITTSGNGPIKQETLNQYIDQTLKATDDVTQQVIDILKSDLPKEEKRVLIKDIYGDVVLPIEIEELLL